MKAAVLAASAVALLGLVQGCASPPRLMAEPPETRPFVSQADLGRIGGGVSRDTVKSVLGPPLNVTDLDQRYDYLVKMADGDKVRFVPYGVFFKDGRVSKVAPLDQ